MKIRKLTALLLTLCMIFSLSVAAFAAEADVHTVYDSAPDEDTAASSETVTSGTIPGSKIKWELNEHNWLMISGSGACDPFTSKDDQPWATVRDQITQAWFDDMDALHITDLAYWFEDCVNLTTAEIPGTTPVIGRHAFYNCPKLSTLTIYYGEDILESIGEDAFWRETDSGDTLYIGYLIGYPKSSVPFHDYDWSSSNRNERYFYDLYGSNSGGTMSASDVSLTSTGSIIGNCPSCGKYSFQGVYVEVAHSSRGHANYNECNACHYVQYLGTYTTKSHGSGAYGSGTCPDCGSHTWVLQSQQSSTCTSNGYRNYSCACGQTKSETIYSSGHSYSYGSWEQYSSSQHRRTGSCRNCGATDYDYASHSMSYGAWSNSSSSQHSRTATCRTCGYSTTEYSSHSYSTGSWSKYSDTQHRRTKTCSGCGASTYDYADHSYSYGSWVSDSETQHKRTKTCSACGDPGYEYLELQKTRDALLVALGDAQRYLLELDEPMLVKTAEQLQMGLRRFDLMSRAYKPVYEVLTGFAKSLPQTDTVNAAVIGRLMNHVRMGYYPTDPENITHILRGIAFPEGVTTNLLDPCCGCGKALRQLANGNNCYTYGMELDEHRAEEAQTRLHRVGFGSFFHSQVSRESFHVLFLNPPYLSVLTEGGSRVRSEKQFLVQSIRTLMLGGLLIYIVPYYRLTPDICKILAENFSDLSVWKFTSGEFARFHQAVVLGLRRKSTEDDETADRLGAQTLVPEKIPCVTELEENRYALPAVTKTVEVFRGERFNEKELERQLTHSGSFKQLLNEKSALDSAEKRPLLPLSIGQIGLIGGSGMINGLIECDTPHIIKGRIVKVKNVEREEQFDQRGNHIGAEVHEVISNKMIFNVLTPNGFLALS